MSKDSSQNTPHKREPRLVWGTLLIVLGVIFLAQNFINVDVLRYFWPVILIALGIGAVLGRK